MDLVVYLDSAWCVLAGLNNVGKRTPFGSQLVRYDLCLHAEVHSGERVEINAAVIEQGWRTMGSALKRIIPRSSGINGCIG